MGMGSTPNRPHRGPGAVDEHASKAGLRTVAIFEATKGLLTLVLVAVLVVERDHLENLTMELLFHLHIGFDHKWVHALLRDASNRNDIRILSVVGLAYSASRFVEAWGLWQRRVWAEWFALLWGSVYLPFEIAKVVEHRHWLAIVLLAINLVIVLYMLQVRVTGLKAHRKVA